MDKYVPCLCYLCNGKLVSRYIRQKHAKVCGSRKANQQQPNRDCQHVTMFGEQFVDENVGEPDGDENMIVKQVEMKRMMLYLTIIS